MSAEDVVDVTQAAKRLGVPRNDMHRITAGRELYWGKTGYDWPKLKAWADKKPQLLRTLQRKKKAADGEREKRRALFTSSGKVKKSFTKRPCPQCGAALVRTQEAINYQPTEPDVDDGEDVGDLWPEADVSLLAPPDGAADGFTPEAISDEEIAALVEDDRRHRAGMKLARRYRKRIRREAIQAIENTSPEFRAIDVLAQKLRDWIGRSTVMRGPQFAKMSIAERGDRANILHDDRIELMRQFKEHVGPKWGAIPCPDNPDTVGRDARRFRAKIDPVWALGYLKQERAELQHSDALHKWLAHDADYVSGGFHGPQTECSSPQFRLQSAATRGTEVRYKRSRATRILTIDWDAERKKAEAMSQAGEPQKRQIELPPVTSWHCPKCGYTHREGPVSAEEVADLDVYFGDGYLVSPAKVYMDPSGTGGHYRWHDGGDGPRIVYGYDESGRGDDDKE